jgi:hypothetical protein
MPRFQQRIEVLIMSETVVVGCKLRSGLILENVKAPADPKQLQPMPKGETVTLKGANTLILKGTNPGVDEAAYTEVDKEFFDRWWADHKDAPYVKNGMVFRAATASNAQAMGKERAKELTGLEPLNPAGDKRTGTTKVEPDKERLAALTGRAAA